MPRGYPKTLLLSPSLLPPLEIGLHALPVKSANGSSPWASEPGGVYPPQVFAEVALITEPSGR